MPKWKGSEPFNIREIEPGLWSIDGSGGVRQRRHSYFLRLQRGNVLVHGPDAPAFYTDSRDFFEGHGGIGWQLLTHHDEASRGNVAAWRAWSAPIHVPDLDAAEVARKAPGVPIVRVSSESRLVNALQAIWLPGHSPGFTAYTWRGERGTYLFGGDLAIPRRNRWAAYGDLDLYRTTVERMLELEVDYLLPNKSQETPLPPLPFDRSVRERAAADITALLAARGR
jgi:glyoxylase-like metal-dependent hydrolase (beta-lactamase superfamily II)